MIRNKKIFITGGAGFIGSNLCKRLIDSNKIVIYDNCRRDALKYTGLTGHKNLTIIQGDILDKEKVAQAMGDAEIVIHLAAMAGVSSYYEEPIKTMEVNMLGTYNVLEAAAKNKNLNLLVNFSTSEVYGPFVYGAKEDNPTAQGALPVSRWTYSVSKLAAEHLCFAYRSKHKLPVISIRPFNIYGPGQVGEGAIQIFVPQALKGGDVTVTGDGTHIRAWCYIDDLVDGVLLAIENKKAIGEVFNIGNPSGTITIIDLVKMIIRLCNSKSKIRWIAHQGQDVQLRVPDISKAKNILGFEPKIGLEEGLKRSIEWYKKYS